MAYLQLPNGKYLKIPEGMSPDQAYTTALEKFPNLLEEPAQKKGLGAALGKGAESTLSSLRTGLESIVSPEKAAKKGLTRGQELSDKYADQIGTEKLKEAYEKSGLIGAGGELVRQVPLAIAEQLPNLATMYAGAKLGAKAPIPGAYGKLIGAGLGALAPSALQQFGSNVERQAAEQTEAGQPINISRGKAAAAAAPQAALDVAASFIPLGGKVAGKVFGPEVEKLLMRGGTEAAEKLAKESFAKTLGKGLAVGAAAEIPTEITQQMLERAQAGLSLTSPDALKEYGETAYQVGLLAPIGGAGRFIDKSSAQAGVRQRKEAEEQKLAEEQAKVAEEERLNKEAMDQMAAIAAENKPTFALSEQQIEQMRGELGSQRTTLQNELDRLRTEAQKESNIDKLVEISTRAEQIQAGIDELSPEGIKRKIKETSTQLASAKKELKAAEKAKDNDRIAELNTTIASATDSLEDLKAKLPAYEIAAAAPEAKPVKDQIATKLKAIDKARDTGDMMSLAKLAREVKALQRQYAGEQTSLFETADQGFAYPEAERRETTQARELEATRPDLVSAKAQTPEEKLMDETMDLLRESLPEQEKKQIQEIKMLPLGELRARLTKLEADRREILKDNPELLKTVNEEDMLAALEKGKKAKPAFTQAANKLTAIEDSILATQQRITEEEFGKQLPQEIPQSLYDLPRGFPKAKYQRFAEQTKRNAEESFEELTQTLFNMSKGIEDDIANTPELLTKKIEGLRAVVVRNLLREANARRYAEGTVELSTDAALKLASRVDVNLRELINRIPALRKNKIIDRLGMAVEPRLEIRGMPSQIKFKKQQTELADIRAELVKVDTRIKEVLDTSAGTEARNLLSRANTPEEIKVSEAKINALPNMKFLAERKRKLESRQAFLEEQIGSAVTGKGLQPTIVQKLGRITIDPRELGERPFANLKRALQIFNEDFRDAVDEATQTTGKVQKTTPLEEGKLAQERDPVAALNALLPKTNQVKKLKTQLYQAQNAVKPDADLIKDLKNQIVDLASNKRSAALYLGEIEKTKAKETTEAIAKEKAEEPKPKEGGISRLQGELFPESLATIRATPQNFMRFVNSADLFRLREKLNIKLKKVVDGMRVDIEDVSGKMPKAPTLTELQKQREIVNNLNKLDEVIATYRFNAAQIWQNRRKIADALENALKEIDKGTTPKIEELKEKRKLLNRSSAEYKKITTQINALKTLLDEQNRKKAGEYATALTEHDATVEERNATLEAMQERVQDLMVRNVAEERKILARMERKFANKIAPGALERKKYADKARAIIAEAEADIEKARDKRIATKRIEEQNNAESLAQLPVIRRITRQTRSFTKGEETKALRAQIRDLEKQQEKHNPGSSQYAKLSAKIGTLKADLDRSIQPLLVKVVQAEITPEIKVEPPSFKTVEGKTVAFKLKTKPSAKLGKTTGYDYLTMPDKDIDALLEEAQNVARAELVAKGKATTFLPPTEVKEVEGQRVKLAEIKQKEAEARDELEAAKKKLVEFNREVAATEKALKGAKTPSKIAELKKRLAGLRQSATKQELGKKIDDLTKKYRDLAKVGTGVERMFKSMEDESVKKTSLRPLKTGVKLEEVAKERSGLSRQELFENEAAEAGVRSSDYRDVLDGMERGFSPREEEAISGKGISKAEVEKLLDKIKMPKGLKVFVFDTIPDNMVAVIRSKGYNPAGIKGWVNETGIVVIVADRHKNVKEAEETIAHELIGHVGVEGILGKDGMIALAKKVIAQEGGVMNLAEKLGVRNDAMSAYMAALKSGETKEEAQIQALREVIAHTAEATPTKSFLQKANDFIKAMIGVLRAFLRKRGLNLDISTSDVYKLIRDARKNFDSITPGAYVRDGKINFRYGAAVANPGFENSLKSTKGIIAEQKGIIDRVKGEATGMIFETKYVDRLAPIAAVAKKMEDSLKATQMMYYLRMHDQRMSFVSEVASHGPLDLVKANDGKGFVIRSIEGANLSDMAKALGKARVGNEQATIRVFTLWMAAQRAKTVGLNKLDFSGKITQQMLDEVESNVAMDKQTAAAFKEASDIYAKYNEGLINFAAKTGAISKKDADNMLKNKNFIPFYRQRPNTKEVFLEIGGAPAIKIGNLADQPYLHELIGGDQPILDIFTSALQNTSMLTDMALRNNATKEVANSLASLGMLKSNPDSPKDNGIHKGEGKLGPNTIRFKVDGEMYSAEVDTKTTDIPSELLVKGLEGVNTALPRVVEVFGGVGSFLRKWITRNPAYALRQLIRDPLNAVFVSGLDTAPVISSMQEIAKMWRGKNEGEMLLQRSGILGGQVLTGTSEDMKKILKDIMSGKQGWDYRMAQLDKLSIQGDAATRVVMYNNFIKQGLSDMEATLATLESMNFNKRGISPSLFQLSIMVPFMNAQIQGLNVLYKAFRGQMPFGEKLRVKQKLVQRALMMWAFSMIYASLMQDDEAYQNANDDEKYSNWFVPNPFGEDHIKVPIPFEVGLLFKAVPEALINTIFGDAKARDAFSAIAKMAWNNVPNVTPAAGKPLFEVAANYSFYTGREIESKRLQQLDPGERYTDRTTEIAKSIGSMLNISPVKLEYLIRGYTGSVPLAVASMANPILRGGEAGEQPDSRSLIGSETPLIGSFFQPRDATGLINKAYKDMDDIVKAKQTYNKMLEEGREDDAENYLNANADVIGMASMAGKFRQQMGELTKQERMVRSDTSLNGKEKREQLDEIRQAKIELSKSLSGRE
jgi:DNA-binding Lrp family transcriptional regulator